MFVFLIDNSFYNILFFGINNEFLQFLNKGLK